jgi:MFS family permease
VAFVLVASIPASNLLVMETSEKKSWFRSFANFALMSNLGAAAGLLVGLVWTAFAPLGLFLVFCTGAAYLSLFLASVLVSEPPITLETANLRFNPWTFFSGLYHIVINGVQLVGSVTAQSLSLSEIARTYRMMVAGASKGRTLLFFSTFFYMFSNALIGTTYIPFLSSFGVSISAVFGITLANAVVQILAYRVLTFFTRKLGEARTAIYSIIISGTSIFLIGGSALLVTETFPVVVINIVLFALLGLGFALWNSSTSVVLFTTLGTDKQAGLLGAYSALSGFGVVIGSVLSGFISFYSGYTIDFVLSSVLTVFSFLLLEGAFNALGRRETPSAS